MVQYIYYFPESRSLPNIRGEKDGNNKNSYNVVVRGWGLDDLPTILGAEKVVFYGMPFLSLT